MPVFVAAANYNINLRNGGKCEFMLLSKYDSYKLIICLIVGHKMVE